jgi:hypothetical protein
MYDFKLSRRRNVIKFSWAISHVSVERKTNVSESCVFIIRVDVVNDRMSLTFIPIYQIVPFPVGVL